MIAMSYTSMPGEKLTGATMDLINRPAGIVLSIVTSLCFAMTSGK